MPLKIAAALGIAVFTKIVLRPVHSMSAAKIWRLLADCCIRI
jgi:hypothetical protein